MWSVDCQCQRSSLFSHIKKCSIDFFLALHFFWGLNFSAFDSYLIVSEYLLSSTTLNSSQKFHINCIFIDSKFFLLCSCFNAEGEGELPWSLRQSKSVSEERRKIEKQTFWIWNSLWNFFSSPIKLYRYLTWIRNNTVDACYCTSSLTTSTIGGEGSTTATEAALTSVEPATNEESSS